MVGSESFFTKKIRIKCNNMRMIHKIIFIKVANGKKVFKRFFF